MLQYSSRILIPVNSKISFFTCVGTLTRCKAAQVLVKAESSLFDTSGLTHRGFDFISYWKQEPPLHSKVAHREAFAHPSPHQIAEVVCLGCWFFWYFKNKSHSSRSWEHKIIELVSYINYSSSNAHLPLINSKCECPPLYILLAPVSLKVLGSNLSPFTRAGTRQHPIPSRNH